MRVLYCKSVTKAGQHLTEKSKIKFSTRYNLRRKATLSSINTRNDKGMHAKPMYRKRKGGDNRNNLELVNSHMSNNSRMTDD